MSSFLIFAFLQKYAHMHTHMLTSEGVLSLGSQLAHSLNKWPLGTVLCKNKTTFDKWPPGP